MRLCLYRRRPRFLLRYCKVNMPSLKALPTPQHFHYEAVVARAISVGWEVRGSFLQKRQLVGPVWDSVDQNSFPRPERHSSFVSGSILFNFSTLRNRCHFAVAAPSTCPQCGPRPSAVLIKGVHHGSAPYLLGCRTARVLLLWRLSSSPQSLRP